MRYIEMVENLELKAYFEMLCDGDYPDFIDKYLSTATMVNLKTKSQFCGCDYTKLYTPKFFYTRFDHSIASALMTWHFTHDKKQTIAALLHDAGTPVFAHCVDFLLKDSKNQRSSEKNINEVLAKDSTLIECLTRDNLQIKDVANLENHPILENESPKLCVDRLEGVLHTGFIWLNFWELANIKEIYQNIRVLKNEDNIQELGFADKYVCEKFTYGIFKYAAELQSNENKFATQFVADCIEILIKNNVINFDDLYNLSEEDIINYFENDNEIKILWKKFNNLKMVFSTDEQPNGYYVSVESKKRIVNPLCKFAGVTKRIKDISSYAKKKFNDYNFFREKEYVTFSKKPIKWKS